MPHNEKAIQALQDQRAPWQKALGSVLTAPAEALEGLFYDPTQPAPEDASLPYKVGALLSVAPMHPALLRASGMKVLGRARTLPTLSGFGPEAVSALTELQRQYPRTFGLLHSLEPMPEQATKAGLFRKVYGRQAQSAPGRPYSDIELAPGLTREQAAETAAHELTHAAQTVRNPRTSGAMYQLANETLGYQKNPYEITANIQGKRFAERLASPKIKPGPSEFIEGKANVGQELMNEKFPTPQATPAWEGLRKIRSLFGL